MLRSEISDYTDTVRKAIEAIEKICNDSSLSDEEAAARLIKQKKLVQMIKYGAEMVDFCLDCYVYPNSFWENK